MKIGILTLPLHVNYGGILQCYALQTLLERMGHEVIVLNDNCSSVNWPTRARLVLTRQVKTFLQGRIKFYGNKTEWEIISQHTQQFISRYIHYYNVNGLPSLKDEKFDVLVVGSDQIWRPKYYPNIANAFLAFAQNWHDVKRISYAASFGTDKWEYTQEETDVCAQLVKLFDGVSVREKSGVSLCRQYLGAEAVQVLDPTMMLNADDYLALIDNAKDIKRHEGGLYYYFLDESEKKLSISRRIAESKGLCLYKSYNPNVERRGYFEQRIQPPVEQWIAGFRDSDFVVTDSFHGCAFSIIFNKPFVAIGNKNRGLSRFASLLELFNLQNRLICEDNYSESPVTGDIDFHVVNKKLKLQQEQSTIFFRHTLYMGQPIASCKTGLLKYY